MHTGDKVRGFFQRGGFFYGIVYLVWRSWEALPRLLFTLLYRHALKACGTGSVFAQGVYIANPRNVEIGKNCYVGADVQIGSETPDGALRCGDQVQISEGCRIDHSGGVMIGDRTLLSANARIYSHDHGYDPRSKPTPVKITIAEDVWIGAGAMILPSTGSIGKQAIVGAGAVVTKPVPEGAIVAGNPARIVKMRTPTHIPASQEAS